MRRRGLGRMMSLGMVEEALERERLLREDRGECDSGSDGDTISTGIFRSTLVSGARSCSMLGFSRM